MIFRGLLRASDEIVRKSLSPLSLLSDWLLVFGHVLQKVIGYSGELVEYFKFKKADAHSDGMTPLHLEPLHNFNLEQSSES
jgi:hypothetical protein